MNSSPLQLKTSLTVSFDNKEPQEHRVESSLRSSCFGAANQGNSICNRAQSSSEEIARQQYGLIASCK